MSLVCIGCTFPWRNIQIQPKTAFILLLKSQKVGIMSWVTLDTYFDRHSNKLEVK